MNSAALPTPAADRIVTRMGRKNSSREESLRLIDVAFEKGQITQIEARRLEAFADRKWPA